MTTNEVRAIWGEPTDTVQEEPGNGSRFLGLVVRRLNPSAVKQ
jgi:hypothetical protein